MKHYEISLNTKKKAGGVSEKIYGKEAVFQNYGQRADRRL